MDKYNVLKMKTCVLNLHCVCEGCQRKIKLLLQNVGGVYTVSIDAERGRVKVKGNFDTHYLTRKLEKLAKCTEMVELPKSSPRVKSFVHPERSLCGNGGLFGFVKFFGRGEKGPKPSSKKSHCEKGGRSGHGGSIKGSSRKYDFHGVVAGYFVPGSSRAGSKWGPMCHHSGDPPMAAMTNRQGALYYDAPHRPMSPPPPQRESFQHLFSDENPNACNIM